MINLSPIVPKFESNGQINRHNNKNKREYSTKFGGNFTEKSVKMRPFYFIVGKFSIFERNIVFLILFCCKSFCASLQFIEFLLNKLLHP